MNTKGVRLYFEDECPRIGAGWRTVYVKTGRKWIYFRDPTTGARAKIAKSKPEFQSLIRSIPPLTK